MAKRTTRTNAETLENVRRQAAEQGARDAVEELAGKLLENMPAHRERGLQRAKAFLQGYHAGAAACGVTSAAGVWAQDIQEAQEIINKLRELDCNIPF